VEIEGRVDEAGKKEDGKEESAGDQWEKAPPSEVVSE